MRGHPAREGVERRAQRLRARPGEERRVLPPGGPVTEKNFTAYRAHRKAWGAQGVGPTQLTLPAFQDRADARGGCHLWRVNTLVGFEILADLIGRHGIHGGFRRYNGSGPRAEAYADDAVARCEAWRKRLGHVPMTPAKKRPALKWGDSGAAVVKLQEFLNATFPLYSDIDVGLRRYGQVTAQVVAEFQRRAGVVGKGVDVTGRSVGPRTWAALEVYGYS